VAPVSSLGRAEASTARLLLRAIVMTLPRDCARAGRGEWLQVRRPATSHAQSPTKRDRLAARFEKALSRPGGSRIGD
jgi:hypothetical protein